MKKLARVYFDPSHPAGFSSALKLAKATGVPLKKVKTWLAGQRTYTLHKPVKKKFKRSTTLVAGIDHQWQADLSDLSSIAAKNDSHRFLLCVIDVFSKYAWVVPIKDKKGETLVNAFRKIKGRKPLRLQTDKGTEFLNRKFQTYLKKNDIHFFVTHNAETKASVVERFQRTLKERMWRYFTFAKTERYVDVLDQLVRGYNAAVHRSIGMAPEDVTVQNEWLVSRRLYRDEPTKKRNIESVVRLALDKQKAFDKGYWPNWTLETFRVKPSTGSRYKLIDGNGEPLEGSFYPEELQEVYEDENEAYPVEKIVERKGKNLLVKWKDYPSSFNSWIPESSLEYK